VCQVENVESFEIVGKPDDDAVGVADAETGRRKLDYREDID
jgi:hypothetical protein